MRETYGEHMGCFELDEHGVQYAPDHSVRYNR